MEGEIYLVGDEEEAMEVDAEEEDDMPLAIRFGLPVRQGRIIKPKPIEVKDQPVPLKMTVSRDEEVALVVETLDKDIIEDVKVALLLAPGPRMLDSSTLLAVSGPGAEEIHPWSASVPEVDLTHSKQDEQTISESQIKEEEAITSVEGLPINSPLHSLSLELPGGVRLENLPSESCDNGEMQDLVRTTVSFSLSELYNKKNPTHRPLADITFSFFLYM